MHHLLATWVGEDTPPKVPPVGVAMERGVPLWVTIKVMVQAVPEAGGLLIVSVVTLPVGERVKIEAAEQSRVTVPLVPDAAAETSAPPRMLAAEPKVARIAATVVSSRTVRATEVTVMVEAVPEPVKYAPLAAAEVSPASAWSSASRRELFRVPEEMLEALVVSTLTTLSSDRVVRTWAGVREAHADETATMKLSVVWASPARVVREVAAA